MAPTTSSEAPATVPPTSQSAETKPAETTSLNTDNAGPRRRPARVCTKCGTTLKKIRKTGQRWRTKRTRRDIQLATGVDASEMSDDVADLDFVPGNMRATLTAVAVADADATVTCTNTI